jgi:histidinol-phosphate aminotransferase
MTTSASLLPHIARMAGYLPGEQPLDSNTIKLNTNENPYPASPMVMARLRAAVGDGLRWYPDAGATGVRQRLSVLFDIPVEQFVIGNGSDELLNVAVRCFAGPGDTVAYATPSYPYYAKLIDLQAARSVTIEFDDDFGLPAGLADTDAVMTFVPNPNSPSGTAVSSASLADLAGKVPGILVIDEAYVDFSREGAIDLVQQHANVLVMRTL